MGPAALIPGLMAEHRVRRMKHEAVEATPSAVRMRKLVLPKVERNKALRLARK